MQRPIVFLCAVALCCGCCRSTDGGRDGQPRNGSIGQSVATAAKPTARRRDSAKSAASNVEGVSVDSDGPSAARPQVTSLFDSETVSAIGLPDTAEAISEIAQPKCDRLLLKTVAEALGKELPADEDSFLALAIRELASSRQEVRRRAAFAVLSYGPDRILAHIRPRVNKNTFECQAESHAILRRASEEVAHQPPETGKFGMVFQYGLAIDVPAVVKPELRISAPPTDAEHEGDIGVEQDKDPWDLLTVIRARPITLDGRTTDAELLQRVPQLDEWMMRSMSMWGPTTRIPTEHMFDALALAAKLKSSAGRLRGEQTSERAAMKEHLHRIEAFLMFCCVSYELGTGYGTSQNLPQLLRGHAAVVAELAKMEGDRQAEDAARRKAIQFADLVYAAQEVASGSTELELCLFERLDFDWRFWRADARMAGASLAGNEGLAADAIAQRRQATRGLAETLLQSDLPEVIGPMPESVRAYLACRVAFREAETEALRARYESDREAETAAWEQFLEEPLDNQNWLTSDYQQHADRTSQEGSPQRPVFTDSSGKGTLVIADPAIGPILSKSMFGLRLYDGLASRALPWVIQSQTHAKLALADLKGDLQRRKAALEESVMAWHIASDLSPVLGDSEPLAMLAIPYNTCCYTLARLRLAEEQIAK